jgi:hypothetical protein
MPGMWRSSAITSGQMGIEREALRSTDFRGVTSGGPRSDPSIVERHVQRLRVCIAKLARGHSEFPGQ